MRVKELEQRVLVLEGREVKTEDPDLRERLVKLEMQYRALNARTSKAGKLDPR
jgi:hypothetical protein